MLEQLLNPILDPLLRLPPIFAVLIVSLFVSIIITIAYKYLTDQKQMKSWREDIKKHQEEMKKHKDNPKKMMEVQKKAMDINLKVMTHSFKPTLVTIIPVLLIFGWFNGHLGFEPIRPGSEFLTTINFKEGFTGNAVISIGDGVQLVDDTSEKAVEQGSVSWKLKAEEGEHLLQYSVDSKKYSRVVLVTTEQDYAPPVGPVNDEYVSTININNKPLKVLNLFGWKLSWLWTYIIFSLAFSTVLRKIMKLH